VNAIPFLVGAVLGFLLLAALGRRLEVATDNTDNAGVLEKALDFTYTAENFLRDAAGSRRSTSIAGLDALKNHEGFSATAYQDTAGNWTIGYGHKLQDGESFDAIDQAQATALLAGDVRAAEDAVNSLVSAPLSQTQFDALVSFVYNVGAGAFRKSTLLAKLNAGDVAGATAEFSRWTHSGGKVDPILVARREDEARLFLEG